MPPRGGSKVCESGSSGNVQYLVGGDIGGALVGFTGAEFDEDDGPGRDVDGGDAGHGGVSGRGEEVRGDVLDAVGRRGANREGHGLDGQASGCGVVGRAGNKLVDSPVVDRVAAEVAHDGRVAGSLQQN